MSKTRLYLVRHGETELNKVNKMQGRGIDAPLNTNGLKQANLVAEFLRDENPDQLFTSSLQRSIQTAKPLNDCSDCQVQSFPELDEMNFGIFEGCYSADVQKEMDKVHNAWKQGQINRPMPDGESPVEVFKRANGRLTKLLEKYRNQTLIFILHGRLIRILLSEWLGLGLKNMHQIEHQNGAINHIHSNGKSFEAVYLNKTDHLEI